MNNSKKYVQDIFYRNIEIYKKSIIIFLILFVLIIMSFYISEQYRVKVAITNMKYYDNYLSLDSFRNYKELRLCDFYVASCFRPVTAINQKLDYVSADILKKILKYGARFLWFDIFNSNLGENPIPLVSVGSKNGVWNFSLNSLLFDQCISTIATTAFKSGEVNNYNDPLFIALNLNVNKNQFCLKKMSDIILKHLGPRLLGVEYSRSNKNMGEVLFRDIVNKVVIFSSSGYEDSALEELINYSWENPKLKVINNKSVDPNVTINDYVKEDIDTLKNYNKNNLTIVTPDENSFFTRQFNPKYAWDAGCQFVNMFYQDPDTFMDYNMTKFKNHSFILKPVELRGDSKSYKRVIPLSRTLSDEQKKDKVISNCEIEPKPNVPILDVSEEPDLKNDNDELGVCFISDKCRGQYQKVNKTVEWIINELDKDNIKFESSNENISAGIDTSGNSYLNFKPTVCCAKKNKLPIRDKYVLATHCENQVNAIGTIGLKVESNSVNNTSFQKGNTVDNYRWVHPKLCKIENEKELEQQNFCVISANSCPKSWDKNIVKLENNWNLCCKK